MKTSLNAAPGNAKPRPHFFLKFFFGLAILGLAAALFLPALKTVGGIDHASPKGQLKADARTLLATMCYVFAAEPDFAQPAAGWSESSLNDGPSINRQSFEGWASISNQTTHFDLPSNLPAQT